MKLRHLGVLVPTFDARPVKPAPKRADPFYLSAAWRTLVAEIIRKRGRRCEDRECLRAQGPWRRIFGDHVVELADGGAPLDETNVLLRCGSCHTRKTAAARARRLAARPGEGGS